MKSVPVLRGLAAVGGLLWWAGGSASADPLPGTAPLDEPGDLAAKMVNGIHTWLDRELVATGVERRTTWARAAAGGGDGWTAFLAEQRKELGKLMAFEPPGESERTGFEVLPLTAGERAALGEGADWSALRTGVSAEKVQWPVCESLWASGWRLRPSPVSDGPAVVFLVDSEIPTAQAAGVVPGPDGRAAWPWRLARMGADVIVVPTVSRSVPAGVAGGARSPVIPGRELLWRVYSELGHTVAAAEWAEASAAVRAMSPPAGRRLGVAGTGEGGWIALLAGAADERCQAVLSSGAFAAAGASWEQPIDRSLWRWDRIGGPAELAALTAPRRLIAEVTDEAFPRYQAPPPPAAPGFLAAPDPALVWADVDRAAQWSGGPAVAATSEPEKALHQFAEAMGLDLARDPGPPVGVAAADVARLALCEDLRPAAFTGLLEHSQRLMRAAPTQRQTWWKGTESTSAEAFAASAVRQREGFWNGVLGRIPAALEAPRPRSRLVYETTAIRGWEVVLDVLPDVFATGILLMPKDLQPGERRPCVVCQHGLEGRPSDVADPARDHPAYHAYAARLAERGYIVFAPQNPYIGETHFRQICRKGWPLGLSLWSFILPQHQQILEWLGQQPAVDRSRIAFYGLSYGGKSAMRLPAMLPGYCLSICSADYNEWVWKTCDVRAPYCYLHNAEYDMVEWNLAHTCNYAELSWLIFPRPFMVERGHDDGVSCDEWVAYEFARTRRHYAKLGRGDRAEIEFFNGPHTINGQGTFRFLDRWLRQ